MCVPVATQAANNVKCYLATALHVRNKTQSITIYSQHNSNVWTHVRPSISRRLLTLVTDVPTANTVIGMNLLVEAALKRVILTVSLGVYNALGQLLMIVLPVALITSLNNQRQYVPSHVLQDSRLIHWHGHVSHQDFVTQLVRRGLVRYQVTLTHAQPVSHWCWLDWVMWAFW